MCAKHYWMLAFAHQHILAVEALTSSGLDVSCLTPPLSPNVIFF